MSDVVWETCPWKGCGYSPFPMEASYNKRVRKTGEAFRCPAGHVAAYNGGLTADQKRIQELERQVAHLSEARDYWREYAKQLQRTCRWIECGFEAKDTKGLMTHMRARHGMPTLAAVREAS